MHRNKPCLFEYVIVRSLDLGVLYKGCRGHPGLLVTIMHKGLVLDYDHQSSNAKAEFL